VRLSITDACTGHGRCYSLAPELFDCDDRGYGVVLSPETEPALDDKARTAVRNCPEGAIVYE
jgi:ferredoxin